MFWTCSLPFCGWWDRATISCVLYFASLVWFNQLVLYISLSETEGIIVDNIFPWTIVVQLSGLLWHAYSSLTFVLIKHRKYILCGLFSISCCYTVLIGVFIYLNLAQEEANTSYRMPWPPWLATFFLCLYFFFFCFHLKKSDQLEIQIPHLEWSVCPSWLIKVHLWQHFCWLVRKFILKFDFTKQVFNF